MGIPITLTVNGVRHQTELEDARVTLLDLLRERLDLTGTKKGCDRGQCGACTVLLDGRRINSCLALAVSHDGADIVTIEGLAMNGELHPVQAAFIAHDAFQCGFCTPGQIMSAVGLIQEAQTDGDPERVREAMSGNLCRCGAYAGITEAVLDAQVARISNRPEKKTKSKMAPRPDRREWRYEPVRLCPRGQHRRGCGCGGRTGGPVPGGRDQPARPDEGRHQPAGSAGGYLPASGP